jgi:GT2 family glycosyltransferase
MKRALFLRSMERQDDVPSATAGARPVDYAVSAFWLLPRRTLDAVGLLDERFFYAPEDVDYCLSIWLSGRSVDYFPAVTAIHDAAELSRGLRVNRFTLRHLAGLFKYFSKHRYGFGLKRLYRKIDQARQAAG